DRFIVIGAPGFEQLAAPQIRGPSRKVEFAVQAEPTGMLDAILVPHARIAELRPRRIWITWCDQIAVHPATIAALDAASTAVPAPALALPTMRRSDPYIHFDRDADGRIVGVRQRREAD